MQQPASTSATASRLFTFFKSKYPNIGLSAGDIEKIVGAYFQTNRPSDNSLHALIRIIEGKISTTTPKSSYLGMPNHIPHQPIHSLNTKPQSSIPNIENGLLPPPIVQPPKESLQMPNYNELLMHQNPNLVAKPSDPTATLPPPIETRPSKPKQIPQLPSYQAMTQQQTPPPNLNFGFSTGIDDIDLEEFQEQQLAQQVQQAPPPPIQQQATQMQVQQPLIQQQQLILVDIFLQMRYH